MQDPKPEQIEVGSAEHESFLQFQAVYLSLYLSLTPRGRESSTNRVIITADALCKTLEFANPTAFRLGEPGIQILLAVLRQHRDKCLGELVGGIQIPMSSSDLFDVLALLLVELVRLADTEPGGPGWRHATFRRGFR